MKLTRRFPNWAADHSCSDYVFFTSYIQPPPKEGEGLWSDKEEMEKQNGTHTLIMRSSASAKWL